MTSECPTFCETVCIPSHSLLVSTRREQLSRISRPFYIKNRIFVPFTDAQILTSIEYVPEVHLAILAPRSYEVATLAKLGAVDFATVAF